MPLDGVLANVSYYGSFAWIYGIRKELWEAATRSFEKNLGAIEKPYLITLIDYKIPSNKPRLWTLSFFTPMPILVCNTLVSHGKGSGTSTECERVGREPKTKMSCVGGFVTKHIYQSKLGQKDKTRKRPAMVLEGLDPSNSNARSRGIRMHGAHYVSGTHAAPSWGCITTKQDVHEALIKVIQGGSFMFAYLDEKSIKV